jgi:hypothetical protein
LTTLLPIPTTFGRFSCSLSRSTKTSTTSYSLPEAKLSSRR